MANRKKWAESPNVDWICSLSLVHRLQFIPHDMSSIINSCFQVQFAAYIFWLERCELLWRIIHIHTCLIYSTCMWLLIQQTTKGNYKCIIYDCISFTLIIGNGLMPLVTGWCPHCPNGWPQHLKGMPSWVVSLTWVSAGSIALDSLVMRVVTDHNPSALHNPTWSLYIFI